MINVELGGAARAAALEPAHSFKPLYSHDAVAEGHATTARLMPHSDGERRQMKLLRALQERVVQPLGGRRPIPVDVRIIATSNVSLDREVGARRSSSHCRIRRLRMSVLPAKR